MRDSVLDMLYEQYSASSRYTFNEDFEVLDALLQDMTFEKRDRIMTAACALCYDYESKGFKAGIKTGVKLTEELK